MCKVICTATCKGGEGKTTSTVNISAYIGSQNKKVCVIDLDPQHNLSTHFGIKQADLKDRKTIYDILFYLIDSEELNDDDLARLINDSIIHTGNVDVIPSVTRLGRLVKLLPSAPDCEHLLKFVVDIIRDSYDYIFIDSHNGFDLFCHNALACSDSVLIPIQANIFGAEGLGEVITIINGLRRRLNPALTYEGILITRFRGHTNNNQTFKEFIIREFGEQIPVYKTVIYERTVISEAPGFGIPIYEYAPGSDAAAAYTKIAEEVMACAS